MTAPEPRRNDVDEDLAAWAARVAALAPPLSEDQRARLRTLLAPGARLEAA